MDISKEAVREFVHGHTTVGTTRKRLVDADFTGYKGVLLRCPGTTDPGGGNDAPVWVGGIGVTANNNEVTGGMPVVPGTALFIPIDKPNVLYVISTQAAQDIAWMLV